MIFTKVDALEETAARNTTILERIEQGIQEVAESATDIKESVQSASVAPYGPTPELFVGYKGVPVTDLLGPEEVFSLVSSPDGNLIEGGWVYVPVERAEQ